MPKYQAGIAYGARGFMSAAVRNTVTGEIYPIQRLESAERIAQMLNDGAPCTLYPGAQLSFSTVEEAFDV